MGSAHYSDEIIREYQNEANRDCLSECDHCHNLFDDMDDRYVAPRADGCFCSQECATAHCSIVTKRIITTLPSNNRRIRIYITNREDISRQARIAYYDNFTRRRLTPHEVGELFMKREDAEKLLTAMKILFDEFDKSLISTAFDSNR